ncbi:MAG: helix-turn-helix domain-containing protein [Burkholderiaceae bacterium]|nr:helix-turn-helix domain-containing protein [Burkholderiaceae bacterium]MCD8516592.1 helix-turn-helix domain-containing protein [Burkholderiaceae bacterium]MCD8537306.1 helix-turn-helix domain-containing protein [Burkholderiaceae bacterium]
MQDIDQLPLSQWAEQLKQARELSGQDLATLAPTLMLSSAQLRAIESGTVSAFHGPGYYLRAVEKYARHLNITLDPPVTELKLTDSQIALNRVKNQPSASKLAKRESSVIGANAMPHASSRTRLGIWLAGLLLVLVGIGTWLAIDEGWPSKTDITPAVQVANDRTNDQPTETTSTIEVAPPDSNVSSAAIGGNTNSDASLASPIAPIATASTKSAIEPVTQSLPGGAAPTVEPNHTTSLELAASRTTTLAQVAPPPAPEPLPDMIEAEFSADCWVEVRFVDGRVEQGIYSPTRTLSVPVSEIERLTFGNAQAVRANRAGQPFDVNTFTRSGNNVARISAQDLKPAQ